MMMLLTFLLLCVVAKSQTVNWYIDGGTYVSKIICITKQGRYSVIVNKYQNRWSTFPSYNIPYSWGQSLTNQILSITALDFTLNGASLGISMTVPKYNGTASHFNVKILNQTVLYKLDVNCLSFFLNSGTYYSVCESNYLDLQLLLELNCQHLSQGVGYRSENYSLPILIDRPYYNFDNSSLRAAVFINSFLVFNPDGQYLHLNYTMAFNKTHYTIIFSTGDKNIVTNIGFCLVSTDLSYVRNYLWASWTTMFAIQCPHAESASHGLCPGYPGGWSGGVVFSDEHKQFWGLSGFNFTKNQQPINWYLNTSSFTDLTAGYIQSSGIESLQLSIFVNAYRVCVDLVDPINSSLIITTYFDPSTLTCTPDCSTTPYPFTFPSSKLCIGCHYQCKTCISQQYYACTTCNTAHNRYLYPNSVANYCLCNAGYVDVGAPQCKLCSLYMPGCATCNLYNHCLTCNVGLKLSSDSKKCECTDPGKYFTRQAQCISIDGCLSSLNGTNGSRLCIECDITKNIYLNHYQQCSCIPGYIIDPTQPFLFCIQSCGNKIITQNEQCDDGNTQSQDGCSNTCTIEYGYDCFSNYTDSSYCILNFTIITKYETLKIIDQQNTAEIYLTFQPYMKKYLDDLDLFQSLFDCSIQNSDKFSNINYQFQYYQDNQIRFQIRFRYLQKVNESEQQYIRFLIQDNNNAHYLTSTLNFTLKSKNYPLYMDEQDVYIINISTYLLLTGVICSYLIFLISIFSQSWIGIQLINTLQWLYFYMFLLHNIESPLANYINYLKFSIGYNKIFNQPSPYDHYLYHDMLLRFDYMKEFFLNLNFSALIFLIPLFMLVIKKIVDWKRNQKSRQQKAFTKQKKKPKHDQKKSSNTLSMWLANKNILSFEFIFGRLFLSIVLLNFLQSFFSFYIQISPQFILDDKLDNSFFSPYMYTIILIEIAFCIWIYIEVWEKLTYNAQSVDKSYKNIFKFHGFKYPYTFVYVFVQMFKIVGFGLTFEGNICLWLMVGFDTFMLLFSIIYRPYQKPEEQKQLRGYFIHNLHIIWNYLGLTGFLVFIYFRNQKFQDQVQNLTQITIFCTLIVYFVSIFFAILRLLLNAGVFERCLDRIYKKTPQENDISSNPLYQLKLEKEGLLKNLKRKNLSNLASGVKIENNEKDLTQMPQISLAISNLTNRIKDRFIQRLKQDEFNNLNKSRSIRTTYKRT